MEALSALAAVAQGCIPAHAQEAAQKAILKADLDRTRLALERARIQAERFRARAEAHFWESVEEETRLSAAEERIEDLEGIERDNEQYIEHLQDKKRKLKLKYTNLCNETDMQYHSVCFLEHTTPNDTERNDRRKFMRLFNSH